MTVVMVVVMIALPLVTKMVVNGAASQESRVPGQVEVESLRGERGKKIGRAVSTSWGDASLVEKVSMRWV